jgi:hypothetical protein
MVHDNKGDQQMRQSFRMLAPIAALLSGVVGAEAGTIIMPAGSTVWMKMNSTACWDGVTGGADDCASSNQQGPSNGIPLSTFSNGTITATTSAEVLPDQVHTFLSGRSAFLYVSMMDTYTVHGAVPDPFNITVSLNMTGTMRSINLGTGTSIGHQMIGTNVTAEIGTFFPDSTNDINEQFRVNPFFGASASFSAPIAAAGAPFSLSFDITATYTLAVLAGSTFSLGYGFNSAFAIGEIDMLHTGTVSFDLPDGVSLTSALGGQFPSQVPVPAALPLFASGLGVIAFLARRRKEKAPVAA